MKVGDLVRWKYDLGKDGELGARLGIGVIVRRDRSGWWWVADGNDTYAHVDGAVAWLPEEPEVISESR